MAANKCVEVVTRQQLLRDRWGVGLLLRRWKTITSKINTRFCMVETTVKPIGGGDSLVARVTVVVLGGLFMVLFVVHRGMVP